MAEDLPLKWRDAEIRQLRNRFDYAHLPPQLQAVSRHFALLADILLQKLPDSPELAETLRKLWEAKNCAVFAARTEDGE